jgi:hypothetical protein
MIKLTFDTNILRDYLCPDREHHTHAVALVRLDEEGVCEIRVVSRLTEDVPEGDLRRRLDELAICQRPRIGTIAEWDVSDWDADFWATDEEEKLYARLFELFSPASIAIARINRAALLMWAIFLVTCVQEGTFSSRGTDPF